MDEDSFRGGSSVDQYESSIEGGSSLYGSVVMGETTKPITENMKTMEKQQLTASYLHPTMASSLPPYIQGEVERIRSSYRTGTFWSIKKLPSRLEPGSIQLTRKQHTIENLISNSDNVFKPTSKLNEVFHPQVYVGTDYDKQSNLNKNTVEEEKIRIDSFSRKPFVISSRIRGKNEDIFHDPEYRFPHLGGGTGVFKLESITRSDVLDQDKFLKNSMSQKTFTAVQGWLRGLHDQLAADWPDYLFKVRFTATDELLVQFERPNRLNQYLSTMPQKGLKGTEGGDSIDGESLQRDTGEPAAPVVLNVIFPPPNNLLNKYMQRVATHGLAYREGLRKRGDRWNVYEVDYPAPSPSVGADTLPSDQRGSLSSQVQGGDGDSVGEQQHGEEQRDQVSPLRASRAAPSDDNFNWYVPPGSGSFSSAVTADGPASPSARSKTVNFAAATEASAKPKPTSPKASAAETSSNSAAQPASATNSDAPVSTATRQAGASFLAKKHGSLGDVVVDMFHSPSLQALVDKTRLRASLVADPAHVLDDHNLTGMSLASEDGSLRTMTSSQESSTTLAPVALQQQGTLIAGRQTPPLDSRFADDKIYLLTYAFYAPWVNTGRLSTIRQTASKNRAEASRFGAQLKKKYQLDPGEARKISVSPELPPAVAPSPKPKKKATFSVENGVLAASSNPAVNQYLTKYLEHDELSFGHSEGGDHSSQGSRRPGDGDLSPTDEAAVAKAAALVSGATGFTSSTASGSASTQQGPGQHKMSIRKSLKSFSKSSFDVNNMLIYN